MKNMLKNKTTREIIAFSLLPFGMSTIYGIMSTALNLYLTDVLGLSLAMTGIVLSATKIWDAINDPMMGMIVDKTHTKLGKCRPYIFWMSFPVIIVTALLFAPVNFSQKGNFIYAIVAYLLYYTVYTALDIPYQGLTPLVFPEDKKKSQGNFFQQYHRLIRLSSSVNSFLYCCGTVGKRKPKARIFRRSAHFCCIRRYTDVFLSFRFQGKSICTP